MHKLFCAQRMRASKRGQMCAKGSAQRERDMGHGLAGSHKLNLQKLEWWAKVRGIWTIIMSARDSGVLVPLFLGFIMNF